MRTTHHGYLVAALIGIGLSSSMTLAQVNSSVSPVDGSASLPAQRLEKALHDLNLSEDQQYQLRALSENHRAATQGLRDQIRNAQQTIANTPRTDPNYAAITTQARQSLTRARGQLQLQRQTFQNNAQSLLTPDQLNTLETRRFERSQRMTERRAERMERRGDRTHQRPRRSER
jgi:Spy/CpxP family protein refolding chaperone